MAGLGDMHGLWRHYAHGRYQVRIGWNAPAARGPVARMLTVAAEALADTAITPRHRPHGCDQGATGSRAVSALPRRKARGEMPIRQVKNRLKYAGSSKPRWYATWVTDIEV